MGGESTLNDSLISFFNFNEAADTDSAVDEMGANTAAQTNTPGVAAGHINGCRTFLAASTRYFQKTGATILGNTTTGDFSFSGWVNSTSFAAPTKNIMNNAAAAAGKIGMRFFCEEVAVVNTFSFGVDNGTTEKLIKTSNGSILPGDWWWFYLECNSGAATTTMRLRDAANTQDFVNGPNAMGFVPGVGANGDFSFGIYTPAGNNPFSGSLDAVGYWNRILTSAEQDELYNGGNGIEYPF